MYDEFKSIYGETIMAKIFIVEDNPDIMVDYRMKLATQLVVNKKRHSA